MKGLTISAVLAVGVIFSVSPMVSTVYSDIYPQDQGKRQALQACFGASRDFSRLWAEERAACYQRALPAAMPTALPGKVHIPGANFVDLWRSAGRGHLAQDDVRFQQQNAAALRELHTAHN